MTVYQFIAGTPGDGHLIAGSQGLLPIQLRRNRDPLVR
jgi:hypothetical protein